MSDAMTQARAWAENQECVEPPHHSTYEEMIDSLAALLTETRTKALEEAAAVCERAIANTSNLSRAAQAEEIYDAITKLKAEGGEK